MTGRSEDLRIGAPWPCLCGEVLARSIVTTSYAIFESTSHLLRTNAQVQTLILRNVVLIIVI
jgi:hypothetical protein